MSRWFNEFVRHGGRVHRDSLSPSAWKRIRRAAEARARRRRAFELGQRHAGKILVSLALLTVAFGVAHWLWEL